MDLLCKKRLFVTGLSERTSNGKVYRNLLCSDGSSNASITVPPDLVPLVKPMSWADVTVSVSLSERFGTYCRVANIENCEGGDS